MTIPDFTCQACGENVPNTEAILEEQGKKLVVYHKKCYDKIITTRPVKSYSPKDKRQDELRDKIVFSLATGKRQEATELITEYILNKEHIHTTRDDEKPEMWIYRDGIYQPNGKTYVREQIRELTQNLFSTHLINEVIRKIETDTYVDPDDFFNRDQAYPHLVPVHNGILNINTRELKENNPDLFFFNKLPVTYDPTKECPSIQQFIREITNPDDINVLQEFTGFTLLREYKYEKSLMLTGSGRNGKTKFLDLIEQLLGPTNVSNISIQDIEKDQYALGELHTKLANIAGDLNKEAITNTGSFKDLVGRGTIQAARKFKTRIQFTNYAKMIFSANDIPRTNDVSEAFFDRWILITFPYRFLPAEEIEKLTDEERKTHKVQNPNIIKEITTQDEMSGFLNWALDGYARLRENKTFSYNETSRSVREMWIRKSDSFLAFCMDHVEEDWEAEVLKSELRQEYQKYCRLNKLKGVSDAVIKKVLAEQYGVTDKKSDSTYSWVGIHLKGVYKERVGRVERVPKIVPYEISKIPRGLESIPKLPSLPEKDTLPLSNNIKYVQDIPNKIREISDDTKIVTVEKLREYWQGTDETFTTAINTLKDRGDIYEPKPGHLGVLE